MFQNTKLALKLHIRKILLVLIILGSGYGVVILSIHWIKKSNCRPQDANLWNDKFEVKLCELQPSDAIDCGTDDISLAVNPGHEFPSANDSCALDALKKHQPVILRRTIGRTDTIDYAGLIGNTKGNVIIILFTYVTMKQDEIQVYEQHCSSEEVVIDPWNIYCKP